MDIHTISGKIGHIPKHAATILAQLHNRADIIRGRIDMSICHRLLTKINPCGIGVVGGIIDLQAFAVRHMNSVNNTGDGCH